MNEFLDIIWLKIVAGITYIVMFLDYVLAPLNVLGPALVVLILVIITVGITKILSNVYTTKRYLELKKKFNSWYKLRQEALACDDREKGKALAKNIDQAELNKVYYDYFFEGILKNILTTYLPVLIVAAYVNEAYKTENLVKNFGRPHILKFAGLNGEPVVIGALFWFVISLLLVYLAWYLTPKLYKKYFKTER